VFAIGHLGDGNLHLTVGATQPLAPVAQAITDAVYRGLKDMGGSFSAEHGIGLEKRASLAKLGDPGKLAMMRAIKAALDPLGILNPGKVLEVGPASG
jgi:FAD/FMN-containing dehydrogenase